MLLKAVEFDGVNHVIACVESGPIIVWDRELTFFCHNLDAMLTFSEVLTAADFQQRLKNLNPRVRFPDSDVRMALMSNNPVQISLSEANSAGVQVVSLKYSMAETPVPLRWEWYIEPQSSGAFYRDLFVSAATVGEELLDMVGTLTEQLCAKDRELEQYRREGCQLRRTTVRTKPFNLEDFNAVNKESMTLAASYRKINAIYNEHPLPRYEPSTPSTPSTPSASSNGSERPSPASGSTPSASSNGSERPSPASGSTSSSGSTSRSRKRKAQESNTNHLERKVKQRRNNPQMEYKNSQSSQEEALIDWLVENKPPKAVKEEPVLEPAIKKETETPQGSGAEAPQTPKAEAPQTPKAEATVKTEIYSEEPVEAKTIPVKKPQEVNDEKPQEMSDDSDQELNELRSILGHTMGQTLSKKEE